MSRAKGILAAGTFTGLILITMLALGFGGSQAQSFAAAPAAQTAEVVSSTTSASGSSNDETLRAWQEYSAQLEQTVQILQQRDLAYRQQLEASNQTIVQLQNQINSGRNRSSFAAQGEREGFEFGDFDD
jgi:outer membrane lipoprotein-sorting protein